MRATLTWDRLKPSALLAVEMSRRLLPSAYGIWLEEVDAMKTARWPRADGEMSVRSGTEADVLRGQESL